MLHLPGGTVTLLVASSAAPGDHRGDAARTPSAPPAALGAALAAVAAEYEGVRLADDAAVGGALCAVFTVASRAVAAACALQLRLSTAAGGRAGSGTDAGADAVASASTRSDLAAAAVRIALNTGEAAPHDTGYASKPLHRGLCLLEVTHGGQILLAAATAELARDALPPGADLRSLGAHRLKDLSHPEQVFQLLHPQLPADFPPLRSLDLLPHNLPVQLTSFIGRQGEIAEVRRLLATRPLVTLAGPGGCGKTRLALQVGAEALAAFADGVRLVELATLADPTLVPQAAAAALGLREEAGQPLLTLLTGYCQRRELLLILDNCEHLAEACADLASHLLRSCPGLRILATSREALSVAGEVVWRVPPLATPDPEHLPPIASLTQYEAVRLFIDRAVTGTPGFAVTNQNAPAVAEICHRLDGIPLAVELAAAWVPVLTVAKIAERLEDRFRLLAGGLRATLPRHQTLRAVTDWSYDLLGKAERDLFGRLAVFVGGFTLEAAEAVGAGDSDAAGDILPLLAQLVHKSLLMAEEAGGEPRYRMLETIRQYAAEKLRESGTAEVIKGRHLDWFLARAEQATPHLIWHPPAAWLNRLDPDHDNLRAALRWSLDSGQWEAGLRLAAALAPHWFWRSHFSEGRRWLEALLDQHPGTSMAHVRALIGAGRLALRLGDYQPAAASYERGLEMARALGDSTGTALALAFLGEAQRFQKQYQRAVAVLRESLALWQKLHDPWGEAIALLQLGLAAHLGGDEQQADRWQRQGLEVARFSGDKRLLTHVLWRLSYWVRTLGNYSWSTTLATEGLEMAQELGDLWYQANFWFDLGLSAYYEGHGDRALSQLDQSLRLWRAVDDRFQSADALLGLAKAACLVSRHLEAARRCVESLTLRQDIGDRWGVAHALETAAEVAAAAGEMVRAGRLLGAAAAIWVALGSPRLTVGMVADRDRVGAALRAALGPDQYAAALAEGRALAAEEAVNLAQVALATLADAGTAANAGAGTVVPTSTYTIPPNAAAAAAASGPLSGPSGATSVDRPGGLTAREAEIVGLVARGLTDRVVAAQLFISPRTVDTHLRNVFAKVGVSSRSGLTAWAIHNGMASGEGPVG